MACLLLIHLPFQFTHLLQLMQNVITMDTPLPSNWRSFISVRQHKRLLINFISVQFLLLANRFFPNGECLFITAGGFDDEFRDQARCAFNNSTAEYIGTSGDHEEADTRVWLHAISSSATHIIIYSPDTDIYIIGLPLIKTTNKVVFVQLKDTSYEKCFLHMNQFVFSLKTDICFQGIQNIEECIQLVYILSGCDYVSYFKGFGKRTFFDVFRKHAAFITGSSDIGCLFDINTERGLYSFYRLIAAVYFSKHCSAFQPIASPKALLDSLHFEDNHIKHTALISEIREKLWGRTQSEIEIIQNAEALKLHGMRCCWVYTFWSQAYTNILVSSFRTSNTGMGMVYMRSEYINGGLFKLQRHHRTKLYHKYILCAFTQQV